MVLSASGPADPEILAGHYRGAGETARACDYYARGADQAAAALAFDHAARLYRIALELHPGPADQAPHLWKRLGDALTNAGRGAEAAQAYLTAAASATAAETLELKRLASTQLLISGHVDEGLALLRTLFGPLGMSMPETPRARPGLADLASGPSSGSAGLRFRERDESQVSAMDLTRIDLCWSAVAGLSMIEPIRGADFQTRGLLLALRAGEPFRIARALAMEAAHRATAGLPAAPRVAAAPGGRRGAGPADRLAPRPGHGRAGARDQLALVRPLEGRPGLARSGRAPLPQPLHGRRLGARYRAQLRPLGAGATWVEIAELRRRWTVLYREAQERGDLYAASTLTTFYMTIIKLAGERAARRRRPSSKHSWPAGAAGRSTSSIPPRSMP